MAGEFDDLIPKQPGATAAPAAASGPGEFDDLIPGSQATFIGPNIPAVSQGRLRGQNSQPVIPPGTDTQTGAPGNVRMLVGSAPPRDRLANLQKYYPDAIAVPDRNGNPTDNFIFTDPQSGKKTLYNPQGLDLGDVSSVGREAAQGVGATVGGGVGALEALPTGELAAPVTVPIMAGIGATAADNMYSALMQSFGGQVDTRSPVEHGLDDAFLAGTTALGSGGGAAAGATGRKITKDSFSEGLLGPDGPAHVANLDALNITPSVGNTTDRKFVQGAQTAIGYMPTGSDVIATAAERNTGELQTAARGLAQRYGGPDFVGENSTPQVAGGVIQRGAQSAADRFRERSSRLYDAAYDRIDPNYPVELHNSAALLQQLQTDVARAPESLSGTATGMDRVQDIFRDLRGNFGFMNFETIRRIRTEIGRELDDPVIAGSTGASNDVKRRLYGSLTADLNAAAVLDPETRAMIQQADRYTRFQTNQNIPLLQKLVDKGTPEEAFTYAMAQAPQGGSRLLQLRRNLTPEEWDPVAGTVLGRMGTAKPGQQNAAGDAFSVGTFLTNWSRLSPEAKATLFGGTRYGELRDQLDQLAQAADQLHSMDKLANRSGTARALLYAQLGGSATLAVTNPASIPLTTVALAGPYAAAKLMTSPTFVRWLVSETRTAPNGISAQIGRLVQIGKANPDISEPIGQYIQALQQNTGQAQQTTPPSASQ